MKWNEIVILWGKIEKKRWRYNWAEVFARNRKHSFQWDRLLKTIYIRLFHYANRATEDGEPFYKTYFESHDIMVNGYLCLSASDAFHVYSVCAAPFTCGILCNVLWNFILILIFWTKNSNNKLNISRTKAGKCLVNLVLQMMWCKVDGQRQK